MVNFLLKDTPGLVNKNFVERGSSSRSHWLMSPYVEHPISWAEAKMIRALVFSTM